MTSVLAIVNDNDIADFLQTQLPDYSCEVLRGDKGRTVFKLLTQREFDVLVLEDKAADMECTELVKEATRLDTSAQIVVISQDMSRGLDAVDEGAYTYVTKPVVFKELSRAIERAAGKKLLVSENILLRSSINRLKAQEQDWEIVTGSPVMLELLDNIQTLSKSDVPIHIYGESGTGKELVARKIHFNSSRTDGVFIAVNCAAFTETVFESEFFGHEKGSFTGAHAQKLGLMEVAGKGTLFIDEIGEMPLQVQAKVLRALETGKFYRVGGVREVSANPRILSASNRDLRNESEKKRFRRDLYWRVSTLSLVIPPLRDRIEDIDLLFEHFKKKNPSFRRKKLGDDAKKLLRNYYWPGNVREFFSAVYRAAILSKDDVLTAWDFPLITHDKDSDEVLKGICLKDVEKAHILKILKLTDWHREKAADLLDIDRKTLYRKMLDHNLKEKM